MDVQYDMMAVVNGLYSFTDTGLFGLALWRIAAKAKAGFELGLKKDKHWEKSASATSDLVPVYL